MASATSEPGERRAGPFVLGRRIAIGGMAEVFEARREAEAGPARYVVKLLLPQLAHDSDVIAALRHEAELARVVTHPNLVAVVDHGVDGDQPWLAMERVDGPSLADLVAALKARDRQLPTDLAVHVVRELLRALACVHEAKSATGEPLRIVHRDVTPQNVLLSRTGAVRLGDFGIARSGLRDGRTRTGVIKGKLAYLAPEQATGSALDARTDLYAAGVILWELLAGAPYLAGASEIELLRAAEEPRFRPTGTGDTALDTLLERVLRRFPEERPARAASVAESLDAWLARPDGDRTNALATIIVELFGPGERIEPPSRAAAPPTRRGRRGWLAIVAGGVLAATAAVGVLAPHGPPRARTEHARPTATPPRAPIVAPRPIRTDAAAIHEPPAPPTAPAPTPSPATPRPIGRRIAREPNPHRIAADAGPTAPAIAADTQRASALAARVAALRARLQEQGLALDDLPAADRAALRAIEHDLDAGRLAEAEAALPALERSAGAARLDADTVRRKLDRVDAALRAARREGRDTRALDDLAAAALQSHLDGRIEETNRRLDQILARLRADR